MSFHRQALGLIFILSSLVAYGQWGDTIFSQDDFMKSWALYDPLGMHYAFCYTNGIRFGSNKKGPFELKGHWEGKVFFCTDPSGKGEVETARILDNGDLQLHASVFDPNDSQVYELYPPDRQPRASQPPQVFASTAAPNGNASSVTARSIALSQHDPHLAYPPPKSTIKTGMTLEDLKKLPWHYDSLRRDLYDTRDNTFIYTYCSDNPTLVDLVVTVRNGVVVTVNGGNG